MALQGDLPTASLLSGDWHPLKLSKTRYVHLAIVTWIASLPYGFAEFGHFLSVNLSQLHPSSFFTEIFRRQLATLQKIEEEDEKKNSLHVQVGRHTSYIYCY